MSKNISLVFEAVISVFNFTAEQAEEWLDENSHLINLNKVTDFNKMKKYSAKHSKNHQWIGRDYWSNYDKVEVKYKPIK